jgi:hypothetical protein
MSPLPQGTKISKMPMAWHKDLPVEEMDPDDDWEFFVEAFQAWKAWRVVEVDGVLLLESITYRCRWIPRQEMVASCHNKSTQTDIGPHLTPNIRHGCGIYSVKEKEDAYQWFKWPSEQDTVVYGRVSIWGNIFKFTKGYISEFAYPSYLIVPDKIGYKLQQTDITQEELVHELKHTYIVDTVPE